MPERTLTTKIEIAAPVAAFLQFEKLPEYHPNGFFKSIRTATPNAPIEPGTKMQVVIEVGNLEPIILENSPSTFSWGGRGLLGTFNGNHSFHFTESETTKGGTTFIQEEQFSGLLAVTMGEGAIVKMIGLKEKTKKGFEGFNRDLKAWVEGGK
ncbi:hypothetical protein BP6252_13897 [Coleophoma cylindrospora]|uniref:Uncharacterized protein n=1 Tax=Coleophoma cylindrospora TaxID=1849047 RepID=A0A3D8Q5A4_9HELO|nr:hypothetical protein BP6252_13897 [Coleophoma cylindrospora]